MKLKAVEPSAWCACCCCACCRCFICCCLFAAGFIGAGVPPAAAKSPLLLPAADCLCLSVCTADGRVAAPAAAVRHFEVPRLDAPTPLSFQQNCELHTVSPHAFIDAVLHAKYSPRGVKLSCGCCTPNSSAPTSEVIQFYANCKPASLACVCIMRRYRCM